MSNQNTDLLKELGVSHHQFQVLFNNLPQGVALCKIVTDEKEAPVDFIHLEVNPTYEEILGLTRKQLGKKFGDFYSEFRENTAQWLNAYGKVALTGVPEHFEIYRRQGGKYFQVYAYSLKKGYFVSVIMDITEQKRSVAQEIAERRKTELDLKESVEKYQYLVKHAPAGIYEIDFNGPKFISVNEVMCQILGYSEQELLAKNPFDLLYDESRKRFQEIITKILNGKKVDDSVEFHVKTKDGHGIWAFLNVKLAYKDGNPEGAFVIAHDITASKKAQQELIFAEKRYRRLYETTQDGIMARDLKGRVIDCNTAYANMLGYTKKELKRLSVQDLLPEKWHEQRETVVNKVLETGRSILFEREYKRKDGSIFPASVRTWRLTDEKGKLVGIWSIVRDITEQKTHQKDLENHAGILEKIIDDRTKQLKDTERLAAIGQTAGMVGHDLRNPLQTVIGELYLAKSEVESLPVSEQKTSLQESIRTIEEQAIYMDKIVSDLQAFVKPVKLDKQIIDLKQLVSSVLETVAIPENIQVETLVESEVNQANADPQLFKRVLINLVTNAVQAMPDGGKLTVTLQSNREGQVSVTVNDTGIGIPDEIKPQIFTPLFTTKSRGQGFGLAVCKRVMEAHGGTITFQSTAGKGAKFTIVFPAN